MKIFEIVEKSKPPWWQMIFLWAFGLPVSWIVVGVVAKLIWRLFLLGWNLA